MLSNDGNTLPSFETSLKLIRKNPKQTSGEREGFLRERTITLDSRNPRENRN